MGSTIFQGQTVKALKDTFSFNGKSRVITGDSDDPRIVAKDAEPGSLFVRTTGQVFRKLDSGSSTNWVDIAKQAQAGKKNYLPDGDFESGDVSFVTTYDDVSAYIDGTGVVAPNITATRNTIGPRAGTADLVIYKDGVADATDQGVTLLSETIDLLDYGKDLFLEFNYDAGDTNYTSGNYRLYAYDVTNSTIIPVVPIANLDDNAGLLKTQATAYAKVLCGPNTGQVRVSIHRETDTNPLLDDYVYIDEVILTPQTAMLGTISHGWIRDDNLLTFTNAPGAAQIYYKRNGDSISVDCEFDLSGAVTGIVSFAFTNLDVDDLKIDSQQNLGVVTLRKGSIVTNNFIGVIRYNQPNFSIDVIRDNTNVNPSYIDHGNQVQATIPHTWGGLDFFRFRLYDIPITGWDQGALISTNGLANKTIVAEAARSAVQALPDSGSFTQIDFDVNVEDPFNIVNISTDRITFPYAGKVTIDGSITFASNANGDRGVAIAINGVETRRVFARPNTANSTSLQVQRTRNVNAGDYATLLGFQQGSGGPLNATGNLLIKYEPDFTVFGSFKENEYKEVLLSINTVTVTANTPVDVAGAILPLDPGEWDLGFGVPLFLDWVSGASVGVVGNVRITDQLNATLVSSNCYQVMSNDGNNITHYLVNKRRVIVTSPQNYKLRVTCNQNDTIARAFVDVTSSLYGTGIFWARRTR